MAGGNPPRCRACCSLHPAKRECRKSGDRCPSQPSTGSSALLSPKKAGGPPKPLRSPQAATSRFPTFASSKSFDRPQRAPDEVDKVRICVCIRRCAPNSRPSSRCANRDWPGFRADRGGIPETMFIQAGNRETAPVSRKPLQKAARRRPSLTNSGLLTPNAPKTALSYIKV